METSCETRGMKPSFTWVVKDREVRKQELSGQEKEICFTTPAEEHSQESSPQNYDGQILDDHFTRGYTSTRPGDVHSRQNWPLSRESADGDADVLWQIEEYREKHTRRLRDDVTCADEDRAVDEVFRENCLQLEDGFSDRALSRLSRTDSGLLSDTDLEQEADGTENEFLWGTDYLDRNVTRKIQLGKDRFGNGGGKREINHDAAEDADDTLANKSGSGVSTKIRNDTKHQTHDSDRISNVDNTSPNDKRRCTKGDDSDPSQVDTKTKKQGAGTLEKTTRGRHNGERPASVQSRPFSARPTSARPTSARPASGRAASARARLTGRDRRSPGKGRSGALSGVAAAGSTL